MDFFNNKKRGVRSILFCIGLIILAYFILKSGIMENYQILFSINIPLFFLACNCTLGVLILRIYRWKYLCLQYDTYISWRDAAIVSISSLFYANITPGKIGDLYKAYFMQKRHKMGFTDGVSMIFYERFFELMILFFAASAIILVEFNGITVMILETIGILLAVLLIFYYKIDLILKIIGNLSSRLSIFKKISFDIQIRKIPFPKIIGVLTITVFSVAFEFLQIWLVALAFGYILNPIILTIFFSLSMILGLVSQIPLGVGVIEGSLNYFLVKMGVTSTDAIAIVLSDRFISMYFVLILGFIFSKFAIDRLNEGTL